MHKVVCTAGHIDHGKTALVKALTGMDTDRLKEEQLRGITIELGFAFYRDDVTIIDLPGHERFIRNMVAGAATVDFAILVVAADDGPMPQTQEHLDILHLLGIRNGLVAITKADLADPEWLKLVKEDIKEKIRGTFLESAPIMALDSISGNGLKEFIKVFQDSLNRLPERVFRPEFRLPVDRSFTIKGFGTVVTGTVISGRIAIKDTVELLPLKRLLKIRGIQIHGKDRSVAETGDRAALNLSGIEKGEISRGDILTQPGFLTVSNIIDCQIELLKSSPPLKHRQRLRYHFGTGEDIGRILLLEANQILSGQTAFAQVELEKPVAVLRGDRFVFRTYSPQTTIGGGVILFSAKTKYKRSEKERIRLLSAFASRDDESAILELLNLAGINGISADELIRLSSLPLSDFQPLVKTMVAEGKICSQKSGAKEWFILPRRLSEMKGKILSELAHFHQAFPAQPGMPSAQLKSAIGISEESLFLELALENLKEAKNIKQVGTNYALHTHRISLGEREEELKVAMLSRIQEAGLATVKAHPLAEQLKATVEEIETLIAILEGLGEVVRLERDSAISTHIYNQCLKKLRVLEQEQGMITLPEAVKILGSSRRVTVSLLEYLDSAGMTERIGDERRFK